MKNVMCLILGGGRGSRLYPLTMRRSEPAVPIGGKYRLIDIPVSNCLNSGINRIYVVTQFLSASLHRHIANTFKLAPFSQGFIEVLAAQQTNEATDWFRGTADAVRQQIRYIESDPGDEVLILYGDQLYVMDFRLLAQEHRECRADLTLAVVPVSRKAASSFGIVRIDEHNWVHEMEEKPQSEAALDRLRMSKGWLSAQGCDPEAKPYLANMGIYLCRRDLLLEILRCEEPIVDLVKDVFPRLLQTGRVHAHLFKGYWDDLGTVRSYYEANLALVEDGPAFDFHQAQGVIYTRARNLPAARFCRARIDKSLVSDGCMVGQGASIEHSLLGVRTVVGAHVQVRHSLILGAHRYESPAEIECNARAGLPPMGIGENSRIERAIIDKDCRIGKNVRITNAVGRATYDGQDYVIRDGIVVLSDGAVIPDGTQI
jgi:glucose-1-phosphate adenylyltransferase